MVIQPKPYNQAHFTVDFECFTHDLCRSVGATQSPKLRKKQLFESFFNFEKLFSDTAQKNTKITFFCTGVSAELYPEVIRLIASHGHEIACHGNYHDDINSMNCDEVFTSLRAAKYRLSDIANQDVIGFRAPRFSLNKLDFERLDVISKVFEYDSSLHFSTRTEFDLWKEKCSVDLIEFPVPNQRDELLGINVKLGGSFLKLFPHCVVKRAAQRSLDNDLTPIFYFHPYDLYFGYDLLASLKELRGASLPFYWYVRQWQWAGCFNWSQRNKLVSLFGAFENIGPLCGSMPGSLASL